MLETINVPGLSFSPTRLVLGTMNFGDTVSAKDTQEIIEKALDLGINHVDTANGYAKGTTEGLIGPLLRPYRDEIILSTKVGMSPIDSGDLPLLSKEAIRKSVDGSLSRLQSDSLDILYLHQPDRSTPVEETLETLSELIQEGKIRTWAVSNYAAWQITELIFKGREYGLDKPVFAQNAYNLLARRPEDEFLEFSSVFEVPLMAYNPLAGGLLATDPDLGKSERFTTSSLAEMYNKRYGHPEVSEACRNLARAAERIGLPMLEASLRWLLSRPQVGSILIGANALSHLTQNVDILSRGALTETANNSLEEATEELKGYMAAYNR